MSLFDSHIISAVTVEKNTSSCNSTSKCGSFASTRQRHITYAQITTAQVKSRLHWTREQILAHQTERLQAMVQHAKQHSTYYKNKLINVDPHQLTASDLSALPVTTKQDVMENWDDIVTDPRLTLNAVTKHIDDILHGRQKNPYYLGEYGVFATGGSSGTRGVFVWDWDMTAECGNYLHAHFEHNTRNHGSETETNSSNVNDAEKPKKTALIMADSLVHVGSFVWSMEVDPEREIRKFSATCNIEDELIPQLNEYQPDRILGYSSVVGELARRTLKGELRISPALVAYSAEPMDDATRKTCQSAWKNAVICNAYGSTEVGAMGFEHRVKTTSEGKDLDCGSMVLAEDSVIFEVLDRNYQPVKDVTLGEKVLATRLCGSTMPLLRYELTDQLEFCPENSENASARPLAGYRRIKNICGRTDVMFEYPAKADVGSEDEKERAGTVKVHPVVFRHILGQHPRIVEYQVQQTLTGANVLVITDTVRVNCDAQRDNSSPAAKDQLEIHLDVDQVQNDLCVSLGKSGLSMPQITIKAVSELPRHPETGKLRRFVPLR